MKNNTLIKTLSEISQLTQIINKTPVRFFQICNLYDFFMIAIALPFVILGVFTLPLAAYAVSVDMQGMQFLNTMIGIFTLFSLFFTGVHFHSKKKNNEILNNLKQGYFIESKNLKEYLINLSRDVYIKKEFLAKEETFFKIIKDETKRENSEFMEYNDILVSIYGQNLAS